MSQLIKIGKEFGFSIADIYGRYTVIEDVEIGAVLKSCKDFKEMTVKISRYFSNINNTVSLLDLKRKLLQSLYLELSEFKENSFTEYFIDYHKIQLIFSALEFKKNEKLSNGTRNSKYSQNLNYKNDDGGSVSNKSSFNYSTHASFFVELKCIEFCKNFKEIESFILIPTGIHKYFSNNNHINICNEFIDNDFETIYLKVMKNYYEYFYSKNQHINKSMTEVINNEGSFFILESFLKFQKEPLELKFESKLIDLIPSFKTDLNTKKLEKVTNINELVKLFNISNYTTNLSEDIVSIQKSFYKKSFENFNDTSVIYSYFRLKEIFINELIYEGTKILNSCNTCSEN